MASISQSSNPQARTITVAGLSELNDFLDMLPAKLEANIMRYALRAGAKLIMEDAKANVPVAPASSEGAKIYGGYAGALRDSLHLATRIKRPWVIARVIAGGKTKTGADVWYAHIIEYTGAVPHTITAKNRKGLTVGGLLFQSVQHPGMKAHPFMRPALDHEAQPAIVAAAEYMKARFTKEGLNAAPVTIQ